MYVSLESNMLEYYVERNGLPFKAMSVGGDLIGFIFAQPGGYDTSELEQVASIEEMFALVEASKK